MAASINGVGTTFYGRADEDDDGSYVVTEWIILVYVPLIPLGSRRVWPVEDRQPWWNPNLAKQFQAVRVPLHMPHVFKGYAVTLGLMLFFKLCG